ncbi:hypothetical protein J8F10_06640 [Gemmata sp. G18]|uniref:Uncharacterized protein n=1 Tax=Gemmata palustris TaxID=2822762 RepID=A0ABS5BQ21_9BACT|nr:hypothetical protein [Gemmata palustris]MBP3954958.1 hypothetical protein [Gemmata palustris]
MTATQLRAALTDAGVSLFVEGVALEFEGDVPETLGPAMVLLQTGLRALITGRTWWGGRSDSPRIEELHPGHLIPDGVTLLCVEGDGSGGSSWDRIHPAARIDYPHLFVTSVVPKRAPMTMEVDAESETAA